MAQHGSNAIPAAELMMRWELLRILSGVRSRNRSAPPPESRRRPQPGLDDFAITGPLDVPGAEAVDVELHRLAIVQSRSVDNADLPPNSLPVEVNKGLRPLVLSREPGVHRVGRVQPGFHSSDPKESGVISASTRRPAYRVGRTGSPDGLLRSPIIAADVEPTTGEQSNQRLAMKSDFESGEHVEVAPLRGSPQIHGANRDGAATDKEVSKSKICSEAGSGSNLQPSLELPLSVSHGLNFGNEGIDKPTAVFEEVPESSIRVEILSTSDTDLKEDGSVASPAAMSTFKPQATFTGTDCEPENDDSSQHPTRVNAKEDLSESFIPGTSGISNQVEEQFSTEQIFHLLVPGSFPTELVDEQSGRITIQSMLEYVVNGSRLVLSATGRKAALAVTKAFSK